MNFTYFNRLSGALSVVRLRSGAWSPAAALDYAVARACEQNISISEAISRNFAERRQGQFICFGGALVVFGGLSLLIVSAVVPDWVAMGLSVVPAGLLVVLALLGRQLPAGAR